MYKKVINKNDYIICLQNVIKDLKKLYYNKNSLYELENKIYYSNKMTTSLRLFSNKGNKLEKLIKKQIFDHVYKCERNGANSVDLCLQLIIHIFEEIFEKINEDKNDLEIKKWLENKHLNSLKRIEQERTEISESVLYSYIKSLCSSSRLYEMIVESIKLTGLEGRIIPSASANNKYSVELNLGYNFPVSTYPIFTEDDKGKWGRENVRVLVVDGVIEKVSEIHKIFQKAFETKKPYLFVARGYGEEVVATISANPKLDICPVRVPWEVDSINLIADISIVCNSKIISTHKGDMLTFVKDEELYILDKVICTQNNLNILNTNSHKEVCKHVNNLIKKREQTHIEDLSEILDKRIRNLNSHTVYIRVGSLTEQEKLKELEEIDYCLRSIKDLKRKGIIHVNELGFNQILPAVSTMSAINYSINLAKNLYFIDYIILED